MNTRSSGVQTADAKLYRLPFANSSMKRLPCLVQTHWMNLLCDPTHMVAKFTNCSRSDASVRMFVAFVGLAIDGLLPRSAVFFAAQTWAIDSDH